MAKPRNTSQKMEIRRYLEANRDRDLTVEEIAEALAASSGIGIATVYRAVKRMEEEGVIMRRVDGTKTKAAYRYCGDQTVRTMHSLLCQVCGRTVSIPFEFAHRFEASISEKTGFSITDHQILLYGICPDCRSVE